MILQSSEKFRIAAIQHSCTIGNKETNVSHALELITKAAKDGAKLALLPELFSTEFFPFQDSVNNDYFDYAETIPGPTTKTLSQGAKDLGIVIIAPMFEKVRAGVYHNSAAVIDSNGELAGVYRKVHMPFIRNKEKYYFRPGHEYHAFDTSVGKVGVVICYDRSFPESSRTTALKGAEIIAIPFGSVYSKSKYVPSRNETVEFELRTRAFENQVYVIATNRVGTEGSWTYYGLSMIIDPVGTVLAKGDDKEGIVIAEIDKSNIERARVERPLLRDRRPETYGPLAAD